MSTMDKTLQVGTLVLVSVGILACAPQKNTNLLPANSQEKTRLVKISVPLETIAFANPNVAPPETPNSKLIAQSSLSASKAVDNPSVISLAKVNHVALVVEQQPVSHLPQKSAYNFYGNPSQPGYQIQTAIFELFDQGIALEEAAQRVIDLVINQNQVISDALAMAAVAKQPNLSIEFVLDIAYLTALTDATKRVMEKNPSQISTIISLGVTLYPEMTRDIITAAALTGEMTDEDAILIAVGAGADPTLLASGTAAGSEGPGLSAFTATPLGSGVGAGGTGGGDTTASTN